MNMKPKPLNYSYELKTIDSHTMGEYTRILYDGCPELKGATMMDKKNYFIENYDFIRTALILEPRGHRDMFGAVLTEPVHKNADFGVFFLDSGGCLNMCGHGSIGVASMAVETGLVEVKEPYTDVVLDTPSGIIQAKVHVTDGRATAVSIINVPSFLYLQDQTLTVPGYSPITYDISFGGSFFILIDADDIGLELIPKNAERIASLGLNILEIVNKTVKLEHPTLNITTADLTEFYTRRHSDKSDMKNCVVFGNAQIDRSPCGTGTSAKLAALHAKGQLGLHEPFRYESITGSVFKGEILEEIDLCGRAAIIPQITGSAYITGINTWYIDNEDPLKYGFFF